MSLTIWKQIESMRRKWPDFRVLQRTSQIAYWEGKLRPLSQVYTVRIFFYRERKNYRAEISSSTHVTVIDPLLRQRIEDPDEPIPHHYPNQRCPEQPILCLHDPDAHEWDHSRPIAQTIVPWTIDWLACYEGWLATGEWTGGGRHPTA